MALRLLLDHSNPANASKKRAEASTPLHLNPFLVPDLVHFGIRFYVITVIYENTI